MGYSAHVEGWLRIDDELFEMGQIGPEWIILRKSRQFAPRNGEIILRVDDHETRFAAFLPNGVDPNDHKTLYVKLENQPASKQAFQKIFAWASDY